MSRKSTRIRALGLRPLFLICLVVVATVAALLLHSATHRRLASLREDTLIQAVRFTHEKRPYELDPGVRTRENGVMIQPFHAAGGSKGLVYRYEINPTGVPERTDLFIPENDEVKSISNTIAASLGAALLAVLVVSLWLAHTVSRSITQLVYDVRQIAKGNLNHYTRGGGAGEVQLLARTIDHLAIDIAEAQEAAVKTADQAREQDLAAKVREALLPSAAPHVEGYDLGAAFWPSPRYGGDFHDFIERPDGRLGLLVCEIGGRGLPAALVGATARSYLRSELARVGEVGDALTRINHCLTTDIRRGTFVSAFFALLDPAQGLATVACAGHKIPLLRLCASDGNLRVVQPDGIALALDKGPIFQRRLQVVEVPVEPGDRLVLANSAPMRIRNAAGEELGEKAFYARVRKCRTADSTQFLRALRHELESFAGEGDLQEDISLLTFVRAR